MQTEDRPVVKERVELIKEHRPVEKEFVVSRAAPPHVALQPVSMLEPVDPPCASSACPALQVETRATGAERAVGTGEVEHLGTTVSWGWPGGGSSVVRKLARSVHPRFVVCAVVCRRSAWWPLRGPRRPASELAVR